MHANSIEHLAWSLPAILVGGLFFPKFCATMGGVVIIGRELYRAGYMTKHGPNSTIRELGAVPLNIAEILVIGSLTIIGIKYFTGPFFSRRKLVKRFTMSPV